MIKVRFDPKAFAKLDFTKKQIRRVIFASHVDLDSNIRDGNPFDTGFSVGSWWAMADGNPGANPNQPAKGQTTGSRGASDPAVLLASIGKVLTLANSAVYIRRLNQGYSPQAPAGWIDKIANDYQDYIAAHCLKEKGKSA